MLIMKHSILNMCCKKILIMRSISTSNFLVQHLNKRAVLKLSGPDTGNYLQSMMTNDIKNIENMPAMFSLLLNARGRVLYDILLYKTNRDEYLVEYESSAVEYLQKHLLMYRLRKHVDIEPLKTVSAWVIYSENEGKNSFYSSDLNTLLDSIRNQEGVLVSVIDPRTNLLGVRVITTHETNLTKLLSRSNLNYESGNSYRRHRYKLGIGEGVMDHPPGVCLPSDTNVDFLNGVSFTKGCYIGQELTARLHFTLNIKKRLMPVVLEYKETYPEFSPECNIVNESDEKIGRFRSNCEQYGLALLKFEEALKADSLVIKDFNVKLKVIKPQWWPENIIASK